VVDKDRVSSILATQLNAEVLMILTNVDAVFEGWGTPKARPIRHMTVAQAEAMIAGGSLDAGGMKPKIEAAAAFIRRGGKRAIIARLSDGPAALRGETGTTITETK
jgi:carbamate kinase